MSLREGVVKLFPDPVAEKMKPTLDPERCHVVGKKGHQCLREYTMLFDIIFYSAVGNSVSLNIPMCKKHHTSARARGTKYILKKDHERNHYFEDRTP